MKKGCEILEFYNRLRSDERIIIEKFDVLESKISFKISIFNSIGKKTIENEVTNIKEINFKAFFRNLPPEERSCISVEQIEAEKKFKSKLKELYNKYFR